MNFPEDSRLTTFEAHRGLLTGVAYRMLGSLSDAEDMVQDAWLRWQRSDAEAVDSPRSWLIAVVSRLCLDRLKSARVQRERYFGTWLPEPLPEATAGSPAAGEIDESVSVALLVVLEKLSREERAGFLLHEVFGHTFEEIARILDKPAPACRKMVSRARARVRAEKPRFAVTATEHEELLGKFLAACRAGELEPLMALLNEPAALYSDGGGRVAAVSEVLAGREAVARFFAKIGPGLQRDAGREVRRVTFNGAPGLLVMLHGEPETALSLDIRDGRIAAVFAQRNPDKLRVFRKDGGEDGGGS